MFFENTQRIAYFFTKFIEAESKRKIRNVGDNAAACCSTVLLTLE